MATASKSFTAVGNGVNLFAKHGSIITLNISGTWVATLVLERTRDAGLSYKTIATYTSNQTSIPFNVVTPDGSPATYRLRCSAFTSGTAVTTLQNAEYLDPKYKRSMAGSFKVGATAGWTSPTSSNVFRLLTLPQSQTGSTCVLGFVGRVSVGTIIRGFYLSGQIESGGGTVTIDANLRKTSAAAADLVDSSVASMTQLSVTADTLVGISNTLVSGLDVTVAEGEAYYLLITATTGASCDIDLQGAVLVYEEPAA